MKKFNINHYMYIQINENGWKYLKESVGEKYINVCIKPHEQIINKEVWYKLQCHEVFGLLGTSTGRVLFNSNVMFEDDEMLHVDVNYDIIEKTN